MGGKWEIKCFSDCAEQIRDTAQAEECEDRKYIGLEHIEQGTLRLIGVGNGSDIISNKSCFKKGDILFGKLRPYFRKVIYAQFDGVCSTDIWVVRAKNGIDQRFLFYWMASRDFVDIANQGAEGTKMPRAKWDFVSRIEKPVPAHPLQQHIGCILGSLDDKIELNRRMNKTLEEMARAIFKSWFVDFDPVRAKAAVRQDHPKWTNAQVSRAACPKLRPEIAELFPDDFEQSELGEVPKGWRVHSLPQILEINPTRTLRKGQSAPYLDMANMPTQGPSPQGWIVREMGSGMKFVNGDTLVARITPCLENGKTAFVDFLADGQTGWGSTEYIVLRPKNNIPPIVGYLIARSEDFRSFAIQQMTGSSGRQRVPPDSLGKFFLAMPNLNDSIFSHFGVFLNPIFKRIGTGGSTSRTLMSLRDTLLPKLIPGEIRVSDTKRITGRRI